MNIAIIHGIGKNGPGFSKDLTKEIAAEFNRILQCVFQTSGDYSGDLNFIEIIWDDILAVNQAKLADIFREEFVRRNQRARRSVLAGGAAFLVVTMVFSFIFKNPWFFACLAFAGFFVLKTLVEKLRTAVAAEFINDIISYREPAAQQLIFERIRAVLAPLADSSSAADLTLISHSLGTVIASEFVWSQQKPGGLFDNKLRLSNFFTMGSPLPLFSLQFGGPEMFTKPIAMQDPDGQWSNIYDHDDPIAYPLKCLNPAYARAVAEDVEVDVGWFGLAHVNYWKSKKVAAIIGRKLALDWLRLDDKLSDAEVQRRLARYKTCVS